jgi:hypothetical protein
MSGAYEPIVVAWFMDLHRYFATGPVQGLTVETSILQLSRGGLGTMRQTLNETLEIPRLTGADITLLNTNAHANIFEPARLRNTRVQLLVGFTQLDYSDYLPVFTGIVDRYAITHTTIRLSLTDANHAKNATAAVPVGPPYFVGAPSGSTSKRIPVLLGSVTDAPTIELTAEATGTLALDLGAGETVCYLREFGAPFPSTGRVAIDTEGAVAYAARRVVNIAGATYLELSGLVRTQGASHVAGVAVALQVSAYQYLIGYQIGTLLAVRDNGVLLAPAEYQLLTLDADRPVSVLQFATKRTAVTVDITSEAIDTTNHVTNGGFESGSGSGWSTSGASLSVGTGQPSGGELVTNGGFETGDGTGWTVTGALGFSVGSDAPFPLAGSYRAALEGDIGVDGLLYQDITTVDGNVYAFSFAYLDSRAATSTLVSNGGFETGDLTDWSSLPGAGSATTATVESGAPEGSKYFRVIGDSADPFNLNYGHVLQQTLSTTPGENYTLTLWHITSIQLATTTILEPQPAIIGPASGGTTSSQIGSAALTGSSTKPTIQPQTMSGLRIKCIAAGGARDLDVIPTQGNGWRQFAVTFTASSASTVLSLELSGSRTSTTLPFVPACLDGITVILTGGDVTQTTYAVGTPGTPTLYAHEVLPTADNWTGVSGTFVATSTTTRISFYSQSGVVPLSSCFDQISVQATVTYDVLPWEGVYRAALTGGAATFGDAYQDMTTVAGEHYTATFVYRNSVDHTPNVLINGSFETGDLAGWSIAANTRTAVGASHSRTATPLIADGQYSLQLSADGSLPGDPTYDLTFYQDVTVTPGTPYTITFWYVAQIEFLATGTVYGTASYAVGTPGNAYEYVTLTQLPPTTFVQNTVTSGPQTITQVSVVVTPTSGTLRFVLRGACEAPATLASPVYFDGVSIVPSSPAVDVAGYQIGTPADAALYASGTLATSTAWRQIRVVFKATSTTTRLTLRSKYPASAQPSYFDAVTCTLGGGGLNPAEAIKRVIQTYQPTATLDEQSFLEAQVQLGAWEFAGCSQEATDVEQLLQRLARQCGSLLLQDAEGRYSLIVLNDDRPIVWEFATTNMITPSTLRESSPQDAISTEFYVHFGVKTGGTGSAADFSSVTYCTPFDTSVPGGAPLQTKCRVSRAVFGKDARRDEYCEWIQDFATANLYLAWLVQRYTTSPDLLTFSSWLDSLPVTVGRMIGVRHPIMQYGGARALAEVIGWQFHPQHMQVEFQARLLPYAQNILDVTLEDLTVAIEIDVGASPPTTWSLDWSLDTFNSDYDHAAELYALAFITFDGQFLASLSTDAFLYDTYPPTLGMLRYYNGSAWDFFHNFPAYVVDPVGDDPVVPALTMTVYRDALYVTYAYEDDGDHAFVTHLWRYNGTTWTLVFDSNPDDTTALYSPWPVDGGYYNFDIASALVYQDKLYLGMWRNDGAGYPIQLYAYDDTAHTMTSIHTWDSGFVLGGTPADYSRVNALADYGDVLHILLNRPYNSFLLPGDATATPSEIWTYDGATTTLLRHFDGPIHTMAVYGGNLYTYGRNDSGSGVNVWNGSTWSDAISGAPDGSNNPYESHMTVFRGVLYLALHNADGPQVWAFNGVAWTLSKDFTGIAEFIYALGVDSVRDCLCVSITNFGSPYLQQFWIFS